MEGNSTSNATSLMTMIMQDSGITKDPNNAGEVSFRYSINAIRMSFLPLIVVGTVTNVLNLAVFTRPKMKSLSTTVYLLALSVADLGVMYFELFRIWFEWMDKMVDPALYMTDTYCKLGNYLNVACRDFSNWLIAAITVERLIVLAAPLKAKLFCTVFRARIITVSMACLIFGAHVHFLIFSAALEDVGWVCWQNPTSAIAPVITAWIEFIFGNTVVFFVLLTNVAIVVLIVRQSGNIQVYMNIFYNIMIAGDPRVRLHPPPTQVKIAPQNPMQMSLSWSASGFNRIKVYTFVTFEPSRNFLNPQANFLAPPLLSV